MEHDVAIIGYGPVGAMAALQLAEAGLDVLVLERSTGTTQLPRAVGLDGESLRAFQRLGLGEQAEALCQPPRDPNELVFANSKREPILQLEIAGFGPNGWADILFFDQPEFEAELRKIVATRRNVDVHLGRKVVAVDQDAEGVSIRSVAEDGTAAEHRAAYAIGCDGASSFVREAIGVGWESLEYDQDWLVVDILQGPDANLPLTTMQVCDPARLTSYICVKDPNRRWEFQLLPGETREEMLAPEKIRELLTPWTAPENYEIRRAAVYQFHAATADAWRVGRVFLAGDAAHQTPPFLGQGLNAGFRDAVNLGWKLPLVLGEVCDERLLDTYAQERDWHARDLVVRAVSVGRLMETLAAREAGEPDPYPPGAIDLDVNGPIVPPMRGGALADGQNATEHGAGRLFRQPVVRGPGGEQRLDELLGTGPCVVGRRPSDLTLGAEATRALERLGGRALSFEDIDIVAGRFDSLFDAHPAAVVRPDRYVFGAVTADRDLDGLVLELGRKLGVLG